MLNRLHKKTTIRLTESRLKSLINETVTQLLTEDQAGRSISAAIKMVEVKLGFDHEVAKDFVRNTIRKKFPILNHNNRVNKFILGLTRMYIDENLENENTKRENICNAIKYVASDAHINEYDWNLNGLSSQELIDRFAKNIELDLERDRNEVSLMQFEGESDYDIVRIDSFEQASQYSDYTEWCVTYRDDMFNSYTSNGVNQFYFCLKNGFESIPEEAGENCPLDEYGLSMIAVLVNENGSLAHCTCRWNHENGGNDNIMTTKEISQVIGMNFYDVFKPNGKWKEIVNDALQRLKNGEKPEEIFDYCSKFFEGYASVQLNGKYNWIDTKGNLLSPKQWFDGCGNFYDGYAVVKLNGKWNFIDTEGDFLFDVPINQWFDYCSDFSDGYAVFRLNSRYNFIDTKGNLLSPNQWFGICSNFNDGYAKVGLNGKYNFIDTEGDFLFDIPVEQWFDSCGTFNDGYAVVRLNGKWNFIDTKGNPLYNQWFDDCSNIFYNGYARVKLNDKWNFIDTKGNLYDYKTREPLGINVSTTQTNESFRNRLTDIIVEKVIHRIQR